MNSFPLINGSYYHVEYNNDDEKLKIGNTNECSICGGHYRYDWGFKPLENNLYEARVLTEHPKCIRIKKKIDKARTELLDAEFELFSIKMNVCKTKEIHSS